MSAKLGTTCPWCGTSYTSHRPNCRNCGGPLPLPTDPHTAPREGSIPQPPPAPRDFRNTYLWRRLWTDGWAIVGVVFSVFGGIFALTGAIVTATVVAAIIGLPFVVLGILFLAAGVPLLIWRYRQARTTLEVLRKGETVPGIIMDVHENPFVSVNNRHPWTITYRFSVQGQDLKGQATTLRTLGHQHQSGQPVHVLYLQSDPTQSTIYPPVM